MMADGEPDVRVVTAAERLVLRATFPTASPDAVFDAWTQPGLLQRWWAQRAELDPRPGGAYHLAFPQGGWHLRGRYTAVDPGRRLAFTWTWDHDPDLTQEVAVDLAPLADGGTALTLAHGPYADTDHGRDLRQSHLDGWRHFLGRLRSLLTPAATAP